MIRDLSYKYEFKKSLFWALIELALGVALFFIPLEKATNFFFVLFGIYLVIVSLPRLFLYNQIRTKYQSFMVASSIIYLILGILLIFFNNLVVEIIVASALIALPIVRIIISNNKKDALRNEAMNILVGVFIILFGFESILMVLRYIVGSLVIVFAIINLVMAFMQYRKSKNEDNVLDAEIRELN